MKYITNAATPVYTKGADGFFKHLRTIPASTEINIVSTGIDEKSDRQTGTTDKGEIVYLDRVTKLLETVVVKSTRLRNWAVGGALVLLTGVLIYAGSNQSK